jgi:FtsH-binding integral membrane protein
MTENLIRKKQETLGRWGMGITALIFAVSSAFLLSTSASLWVVGGLGTAGFVFLWLAIFANPKTAIMLGNLFPLS